MKSKGSGGGGRRERGRRSRRKEGVEDVLFPLPSMVVVNNWR